MNALRGVYRLSSSQSDLFVCLHFSTHTHTTHTHTPHTHTPHTHTHHTHTTHTHTPHTHDTHTTHTHTTHTHTPHTHTTPGLSSPSAGRSSPGWLGQSHPAEWGAWQSSGTGVHTAWSGVETERGGWAGTRGLQECSQTGQPLCSETGVVVRWWLNIQETLVSCCYVSVGSLLSCAIVSDEAGWNVLSIQLVCSVCARSNELANSLSFFLVLFSQLGYRECLWFWDYHTKIF